jgi:hypothetical protein
MHLSETQDAIGFVEFHSGKSAETLRLYLVPTAEEVPYRLLHMIVRDSVGFHARSMAKVSRPATQ